MIAVRLFQSCSIFKCSVIFLTLHSYCGGSITIQCLALLSIAASSALAFASLRPLLQITDSI